MSLTFEWDSLKAKTNLAKHGIMFYDAISIFGDPLSITVPDLGHSGPDEPRYLTVGSTSSGLLLVVVHCDRGESIRIISARKATPKERRQYEQE